MATDFQRFKQIVANLQLFPFAWNALAVLHQQTCQGMIFPLFFDRQWYIQHQIFQRHMAIGNPVAFAGLLDIMACINLFIGLWQITGDGFHHVG
ncbi:hypothetical protein D3C80_1553260 [compost metagenome]